MSRYNRYQPELPYNGTSGHSGTETFKGASASTQTGQVRLPCVRRKPLNLLRSDERSQELLGKSLAEITGLHHGTASGVLSVLHKAGRIARLKELVTVVKSMLM
jgi:hypothetical protein